MPPVWGLKSATGLTPLYPRRVLTFQEHANPLTARYDVEGVTHLLTGQAIAGFTGRTEPAGSAVIHYLPTAQPRARLMGRPVYVADEVAAGRALDELGAAIHDRLIVEDPDRPVARGGDPHRLGPDRRRRPRAGRARRRIDRDRPRLPRPGRHLRPRLVVPVNGEPRPIRPAFAAFRAVALAPGQHRVVFTYEPAGFRARPGAVDRGADPGGPRRGLAAPGRRGRPGARRFPLAPVVADRFAPPWFCSSPPRRSGPGPAGRLAIQPRWDGAFHRFTWAAGIEAIRPMSNAIGR